MNTYYDLVRSLKPEVSSFKLKLWKKGEMIRNMVQLRDAGFDIEGIGKLTGHDAEEVEELLKLQELKLDQHDDKIWVRIIENGTVYNIIK